MLAPADPASFRRVLGHYPTGVCVITTMSDEAGPAGMSVGSFASVSLEPPMVAFFAGRGSRTWSQIKVTKRFCVNILSEYQEDLCRAFASKKENKFEAVSYRLSAAGTPIIEGVVAWIDCELLSVHEAGDHHIVLGRVHTMDVERSCRPLLFFRGAFELLKASAA